MSAGSVIYNTPIAVDYWQIRSCPSARLFFLTHIHADHIFGLTPSWNQPIYCTPVTKKLLLYKLQFTVSDIVHDLEVNESHILEVGDGDTVTVTPIDANHCPGAAMFVFEGRFGRILYTGDFRYSGPLLNDETFLTLCAQPIDVLYLDNTFCDPRCNFPSREDAFIKILQIVHSNPEARIMIGLRDVGKEDLLHALAKSVEDYIGVTEERFKILELISAPDVFRISSSCRIQAIKSSEITAKNIEKWNKDRRTIAIIPTALEIALGHSAFTGHPDIHMVPYSAHSSYEELHEFVGMVEPKLIYPILGPKINDKLSRSLPNRADMSCFKIKNCSVCPVSDDVYNHPSSQLQAGLSNSSQPSVPSTSAAVSQRFRGNTKKFHYSKKTREMGVSYNSSQSPAKSAEELGNISEIVSSENPGQDRSETSATAISADITNDDICSEKSSPLTVRSNEKKKKVPTATLR